jgi:protein-tyrosine phosphatase
MNEMETKMNLPETAVGENALRQFASLQNFRDIAGPGYLTPRGPMRTNRLFRSNAFVPAATDQDEVAALGLLALHDLRTQGEVENLPDLVPEGAVWKHSPVPGVSREKMKTIKNSDGLRDAMIDHYQGFVRDAPKREGFVPLMAGLVEVDGPQVFHCAEGKDRTGWAAAVLQAFAGVSQQDIVADFLITNDRMQLTGPTLGRLREVYGPRPEGFFAPIMIADVVYLEAGFEQLENDYGDVEGYLRKGLHMDDEQLARLQHHLLDD